MTSRAEATECFAYITLPGQTGAVTAGRFALSKRRDGQPLGRFVYGKSYLARNDAVEIDPVELKLSDETYETARLGEAETIVDNMRGQVSATWYDVVRAEGVSARDAEAIEAAFVYQGFDR